MYARLLIESLRRGTRRKLLAVSAVALGTLGATALGEVVLASGDRLAAEMGSYGANLVTTPAREGETLPVEDLVKVRRIFWKNNIVAVAPTLDLRVRMEPGGPGGTIAPLVGSWFDHPLEPDFRTGLPRTRPTLAVEGRWPGDGTAEVAVGRRLAQRLGVKPGSEMRAGLGDRSEGLRVVGIVTSGGEEDDQAFAPLPAVERLAGLPGRFTRAETFALTLPEVRNSHPDPRRNPKEYETWYCTAYPSSIAQQLNEALPGARTAVNYGVTQATADVLGRLRWVLTALAIVALAGAAVGVTAAMTATVLERRRPSPPWPASPAAPSGGWARAWPPSAPTSRCARRWAGRPCSPLEPWNACGRCPGSAPRRPRRRSTASRCGPIPAVWRRWRGRSSRAWKGWRPCRCAGSASRTPGSPAGSRWCWWR